MQKLAVYLDQSLVGHLTQSKQGQLSFVYGANWLQNSVAVPLSHSLPLQQQRFNQHQCRGFFEGILPEESNRERIAKIYGISKDNYFSMLREIGGECAGAVSFLPIDGNAIAKDDASSDAPHYQPLPDGSLADKLRALPQRPMLAGEDGVRISLAGAQNKIVVYLDADGIMSLPLGAAISTHIIKPAIPDYPNIVQNEALCLTLAAAVGIPAINADVRTVEGLEYLQVRRYDRSINTTPSNTHNQYLIRIHQEDFCQALGIAPKNKYQHENGPSLADCFTLIRDVSSAPAIDIQHLLNTVIFNLIVGNNDAHGKNFSLLYLNYGQTRLAPAYDILSTTYYSWTTRKMAMKIGKAYQPSDITNKQFDTFAKECGLSSIGVKKRIIELSNAVLAALPSFAQEFDTIADLLSMIDHNARWLKAVAESG